ncbi:MAG: NAD-dependent epimerase/dehydratase family protein [Opitutaceae bacterium]|jgi:UDP-glucuronate 4-epimerase|nr:NAD-dependent epimerase/dehydratase family protein [Opitutaceae bacterium]
MKVLVTGAAGFIGYHVSRRLAAGGDARVLGIDNLNDSHPAALKRARLAQLAPLANFRFVQADFSDAAAYAGIHADFQPDYIIHLGAQAGVRQSIENPAACARSNITGFLNILEAARARPPRHIVYASSSSVYGAGARRPFSEDQAADRPLSFYGATKRAAELIAHSHAHLHGLALTGLRFFTVYGPWGRPDMAPVIFSKAITEGKPLRLFNEGHSLRDFTYIDDIVDGVLQVLPRPPVRETNPATGEPAAPSRVFNIGSGRPVEIRRLVQMLETLLGKKANIELLPPQPGDMPDTCASLARIHAAVGFTPKTPLEEGLPRFVEWFWEYYGK